MGPKKPEVKVNRNLMGFNNEKHKALQLKMKYPCASVPTEKQLAQQQLKIMCCGGHQCSLIPNKTNYVLYCIGEAWSEDQRKL